MRYTLVFLTAWMASVPVYLYWDNRKPELPPEMELNAYKHCMQQTATSCGCRMTTKDFIRYYELINQLEKKNDR